MSCVVLVLPFSSCSFFGEDTTGFVCQYRDSPQQGFPTTGYPLSHVVPCTLFRPTGSPLLQGFRNLGSCLLQAIIHCTLFATRRSSPLQAIPNYTLFPPLQGFLYYKVFPLQSFLHYRLSSTTRCYSLQDFPYYTVCSASGYPAPRVSDNKITPKQDFPHYTRVFPLHARYLQPQGFPNYKLCPTTHRISLLLGLLYYRVAPLQGFLYYKVFRSHYKVFPLQAVSYYTLFSLQSFPLKSEQGLHFKFSPT